MKFNSYILASNCHIVEGYSRSILLDTQRGTLRFLDNDQKVLLKAPIKENLIDSLSSKENGIIKELIANDILVRVPDSTIGMFQKMNDQFFNSVPVNNCIIELSNNNIREANQIVYSLNQIGCKFIELRVAREVSIAKLKVFINTISNSTIQTIDIYFYYKNKTTYKELQIIKNEYIEVRWVFVFCCPDEFINNLKGKTEEGVLLMRKGDMDKKTCGNISPFYFTINISTYTESKHFNSCLNCKISIDGKGEIRQCPSMKESFGNIKNVSLEEAINNASFTQVGQTTKDQIGTCKDCEFRYVCTDCRAYLEMPKDIFSKPLKCGYNPYTTQWIDWRKDPLKKAAIKHYDIQKQ